MVERALEQPEAGTGARAGRSRGPRAILHPADGHTGGDELAEQLGDPALIGRRGGEPGKCATAAGDWRRRVNTRTGRWLTGPRADHDRPLRHVVAAFAYLRLGLMAEGRRLAELARRAAPRLTPHHEVHGAAC